MGLVAAATPDSGPLPPTAPPVPSLPCSSPLQALEALLEVMAARMRPPAQETTRTIAFAVRTTPVSGRRHAQKIIVYNQC